MSRRTLVYVGIALTMLVLGRLLSTRRPATSSLPVAPSAPESSSPVAPLPRLDPPLRRPPSSIVTLGVLTDRSEDDLRRAIQPEAVAALVRPEHCGDQPACEAVRATLLDEHATAFTLAAASDWSSRRLDLDASAGAMPPAERAKVAKLPRVVVVRVATATTPRQLALRAALAATAAIAESVGGFVDDPLLSRVERAHDFAAHAVTSPLDASAFRRDRIELLYEPKEHGVVRLLTAGLSRWGAPDVEAVGVPGATRERVAEVVLGIAQAIADGAERGPVALSRDDLARVRGRDYPADAGLPPSAPIAVDLVSVHPEAGDPNDFIARIEPAGGDGPIGYLDLAERFFGPLLTLSPEPDALQKQHDVAQAELAGALARWTSVGTGRAGLLVRLPFAIPGDAGSESMWIEVTAYDGRTVTGKLVDEPLGATDLSRGDDVTRPRAEVEDLRWKPAARH